MSSPDGLCEERRQEQKRSKQSGRKILHYSLSACGNGRTRTRGERNLHLRAAVEAVKLTDHLRCSVSGCAVQAHMNREASVGIVSGTRCAK